MSTHRPYSSRYSMARLAAGAVLLATLAACGYKGPLYMPAPPPPPDAALTTPPPPTQPLSDTSGNTAPAGTTTSE